MSFVDSTLPPGFELLRLPAHFGLLEGGAHTFFYPERYRWACSGTSSVQFDSALLATRDAWSYWASLILGTDATWVPTDSDDDECDTFALVSKGGGAQLCRNEKLVGERYWIELPLTEEPRWFGDDEVEAMARFAGIVIGMDGMSK